MSKSTNKGLDLEEVLHYGPICAIDLELGVMITVNGAYLNCWISCGDGSWRNTDCSSRSKDLYKTTGSEMIDEAKEYLDEILKGED